MLKLSYCFPSPNTILATRLVALLVAYYQKILWFVFDLIYPVIVSSSTFYSSELTTFELLTRNEGTVKFFSPSPILIRKVESDPVLIHKIFENHQSDPVLIRPYKTIHFILPHEAK